jgi:hypothetical protein
MEVCRQEEISETPVVQRHLIVADRALLQLASSVVRGDPIKSIVELITNSDDSYRRMDSKNDPSFGRIIITIDRKENSFTVADFAEGMSGDTMDQCVGIYGNDTSGIKNGHAVRGFYGRGLKEAILGLGKGQVRSIKNGYLYECSLGEDGTYTRNQEKVAGLADYLELGLPHGRNGTRVDISVIQIKRMPPYAWINYALSNHCCLRDIMQSTQRRVILADGVRNEILNYTPQSGRLIIAKRGIAIPGFNATFDLKVQMADKPLSQDGYTRDGGLLIRSRNAIHDSTLFKFDYNPYASRIFGEVRCDAIEDLMLRGDLVLNDKRDGLDPHHQFTKALRKAVEDELQPVIDREMVSQSAEGKGINADLRRRLTNVLWEINKLAIRLMKPSAIRWTARHRESNEPVKARDALQRERRKDEGYPILFKGIRLNSYQDPKVRVRLDKGTGIINIAKRAPSVAMYYSENQEGREFLTLVAELISDAVFLELAETVSKRYGSEGVSETYSDLKNKYSHLIHKCMQNDDNAGMIRPQSTDRSSS